MLNKIIIFLWLKIQTPLHSSVLHMKTVRFAGISSLPDDDPASGTLPGIKKHPRTDRTFAGVLAGMKSYLPGYPIGWEYMICCPAGRFIALASAARSTMAQTTVARPSEAA